MDSIYSKFWAWSLKEKLLCTYILCRWRIHMGNRCWKIRSLIHSTGWTSKRTILVITNIQTNSYHITTLCQYLVKPYFFCYKCLVKIWTTSPAWQLCTLLCSPALNTVCCQLIIRTTRLYIVHCRNYYFSDRVFFVCLEVF